MIAKINIPSTRWPPVLSPGRGGMKQINKSAAMPMINQANFGALDCRSGVLRAVWGWTATSAMSKPLRYQAPGMHKGKSHAPLHRGLGISLSVKRLEFRNRHFFVDQLTHCFFFF